MVTFSFRMEATKSLMILLCALIRLSRLLTLCVSLKLISWLLMLNLLTNSALACACSRPIRVSAWTACGWMSAQGSRHQHVWLRLCVPELRKTPGSRPGRFSRIARPGPGVREKLALSLCSFAACISPFLAKYVCPFRSMYVRFVRPMVSFLAYSIGCLETINELEVGPLWAFPMRVYTEPAPAPEGQSKRSGRLAFWGWGGRLNQGVSVRGGRPHPLAFISPSHNPCLNFNIMSPQEFADKQRTKNVDHDSSSYEQKVKGTRFEGIQNPYTSATYKRSFLDDLSDFFGLRSPFQKWQEEMKMLASGWEADNLRVLSEEQYNDAESQVKRLREAGINPDLTGGVGAGEASESTEFDPASALSAVPEASDPTAFLSSLGNIFTGAIGIGQSIFGAMDTLSSLRGKQLQLAQGYEDSAYSLLSKLAGNDFSDPSKLVSNVLDSEVFKRNFNGHSRRRIESVLRSSYDPATNQWKTGSLDKILSSRSDLFSNASKSATNEGRFVGYGSGLIDAYKGIVQVESDHYPQLLKASYQYKIALDSYNTAVTKLKNSEAEAGAFNANNEVESDANYVNWRKQAKQADMKMQIALHQMSEIKYQIFSEIFTSLKHHAFDESGKIDSVPALFTLGSLMGMNNVSAGMFAGQDVLEKSGLTEDDLVRLMFSPSEGPLVKGLGFLNKGMPKKVFNHDLSRKNAPSYLKRNK